MTIQKITPSLWFDMNAEEAMKFYTGIFKNSKIISTDYYPENVDDPHMKGMGGKVINGVFELEGQRFICLDGGPLFKFNEAISFFIECEDQEEVDYLWDNLSAVKEAEQCGWLKDKFGISWQIVPKQLGELLSTPDKEKSARVMQAMLQMKKIVVADLQKAFDGN